MWGQECWNNTNMATVHFRRYKHILNENLFPLMPQEVLRLDTRPCQRFPPFYFSWEILVNTHTHTHTHTRLASVPFLQQMNKCRTQSEAHQFCTSHDLLFGYIIYYSEPSLFHSSISLALELKPSSVLPLLVSLSNTHTHFTSLLFFPQSALSHSLPRVLSVIFCKVDKHRFPATGREGE